MTFPEFTETHAAQHAILRVNHRQDLQIVAGRFKDHLTLAAAKVLEDIYGGWKPIERIKGR